MAQNAPQKPHVAGNKIACVFRVVRQSLDGRYQYSIHPLVGIQVKLPSPGNGQIVDGPIPLRAV
jgi:hypothetical protein